MNDLYVKVYKNTRKVDLPTSFIGNDMENLQKRFVFTFEDEFVNGQARLEYEIDNEKNFIPLTKENETYILPIKNILTKEGNMNIQLVIDEAETEDGVPTFKSNISYLYCGKSLNAVNEAPEGYELWIQEANAKLNQMDNLDISAERISDGVNITITDKEGITTTTKVNDGAKGDTGNPGPTGADGYSPTASVEKVGKTATITITDKTGTTTASISDGDGGGVSDYTELTSKPSINNNTLSGNKTGADLGLLDSSKVKTTTDTTEGNVYDVTYINTMLGNIENQLSEV